MNTESRIRAVVFDLDGTILDTFEHIVQAFELVLPQFGVQKNREEIRMVIGKTLTDCYREFLTEDYAHQAAELHHQTQQSPEMYSLITTYDGLRESVEQLRGAGIKVCVLTNRSRCSVELIFDHVGLQGLFDVVITSDENHVPKPDSAGIELIAHDMSLKPNQLVMVGDTAIDVNTAKNAGMAASFALTHCFGTRTELKEAEADYIIESLSELVGFIESLNHGKD